MHIKIEAEVRSEYRSQALVQLLREQVELNHLCQSATVAFILHQRRSDTDNLYLKFLTEKINILHQVIEEKKHGKKRRG